jgi:hypothetical protein
MSLWTIVPVIGLCITVPAWLWLRLTRPHKATDIGNKASAK